MQILTIEDSDFNALLSAFRQGREVGKYWRGGKVQVVCATRQFMLVTSSHNGSPEKIAIKPARSLSEAETLALQLLIKEEQRGSEVERSAEFIKP